MCNLCKPLRQCHCSDIWHIFWEGRRLESWIGHLHQLMTAWTHPSAHHLSGTQSRIARFPEVIGGVLGSEKKPWRPIPPKILGWRFTPKFAGWIFKITCFLRHFQVEPEKSLLSHFRVALIVFEFGLCSCRPHSQPFIGLAGAWCREFREFMRNLMKSPWENPQRSIIIRTEGRNTRVMMDLCGFSQGMPSEFAWISEIPSTMLARPPLQSLAVKKITFFLCNFWVVKSF